MVAQKIRENGRKWEKMEKSRKDESFPPILLLSKKLSLITVQEHIYCPSQAKLQKKQHQKLLQGTNLEENQKGNKISQKATGHRKVNSGLQDE